jgi:hypothetical protein
MAEEKEEKKPLSSETIEAVAPVSYVYRLVHSPLLFLNAY